MIIIEYILFILYKTYGELVSMEIMCQPWIAGSSCGFTEGCRNWKRCVQCVELAVPWISNQRMWKGRRALPLTSSSVSHDMTCFPFLMFSLLFFECWALLVWGMSIGKSSHLGSSFWSVSCWFGRPRFSVPGPTRAESCRCKPVLSEMLTYSE